MNKDPGPSEETGNVGEDFNAMSREEGRYRSCHLFLSGDDSSPLSVASSPENVSLFFFLIDQILKNGTSITYVFLLSRTFLLLNTTNQQTNSTR